jgi:hypothetical protein
MVRQARKDQNELRARVQDSKGIMDSLSIKYEGSMQVPVDTLNDFSLTMHSKETDEYSLDEPSVGVMDSKHIH